MLFYLLVSLNAMYCATAMQTKHPARDALSILEKSNFSQAALCQTKANVFPCNNYQLAPEGENWIQDCRTACTKANWCYGISFQSDPKHCSLWKQECNVGTLGSGVSTIESRACFTALPVTLTPPTVAPTPAPTDARTPAPPPPTPERPTPCDESSGTCTVFEDPHIEVFDGAHVSLIAKSSSRSTLYNNGGAGDKWLVKSDRISIQARYQPDDRLPDRNLFMRACAVSGSFLQGNTIVIGSLEDQITYNGMPILKKNESAFDISEGPDFFVKATRGAQSMHVEDMAKENQGVNIELPSGVSLVANRLQHHVNIAIKMGVQEGGQEGLCGNHDGFAGDDSIELSNKRFNVDVLPEESLFFGMAFD